MSTLVDWDKYFVKNVDWSEHWLKKGDPAAPTYYIIRRAAGVTAGLISNYLVFARHIWYALSNGYLPVIDMQNYPNAYLSPELLGKENSWEYYFEQPLRIGLEQAFAGENVLLSSGAEDATMDAIAFPGTETDLQFYNDRNIGLQWRMLVKLGLLKIKPKLQKEIDDTYNKLFAPNDRVLGVHLRGTDYIARRPYLHPIPPPMEFALSHTVAKAQKWKCNKIFLATEDKTFLPPFKQIFGDACVTIERGYIDYDPQKLSITPMNFIDRENDFYLRGKEYLTEIVLLSKCNSLIASRCSGSQVAIIMSESFEHVYAFNLGRYGVVDLNDLTDDD